MCIAFTTQWVVRRFIPWWGWPLGRRLRTKWRKGSHWCLRGFIQVCWWLRRTNSCHRERLDLAKFRQQPFWFFFLKLPLNFTIKFIAVILKAIHIACSHLFRFYCCYRKFAGLIHKNLAGILSGIWSFAQLTWILLLFCRFWHSFKILEWGSFLCWKGIHLSFRFSFPVWLFFYSLLCSNFSFRKVFSQTSAWPWCPIYEDTA